MNGLKDIEFSNNEFQCIVENDIAVLTIKGNAFNSVSSITRNLDIIPWFDKVEKSLEVRGVLVLNEKEAMSENAYVNFLKDIIGDEFDSENPKEISRFVKNEIRAREITILGNLIRKVISFRKIIVIAINGDIVSPFFGLSLAADFRFASANTNFILSHIKYRLHPSGALPFFLPNYLGQSKVAELLFRGTKLPATELKKLGLINDFYDDSEFIERAKDEATQICKVSLNVVQSTKKLLYRYKNSLNEYLDLESEFMMR
ncbi:MAG: enoyl-CoA hydratase/isomerase family protein [Bacteroidetes bacterium]|nr:enoyl-CoA hydratase/isomerase family protein [Bacteroidota bacterium]MBU1116209.1 enoyl-CoA hydratase/isomerase family protein [Bacteroidota bacterium]MBU1799883.1 enoyl-CoA hydratase/isomerase family protein [Bacteroidota bacterium]